RGYRGTCEVLLTKKTVTKKPGLRQPGLGPASDRGKDQAWGWARLAADSSSSFFSSPDSYISVMMSQPPTSSPSTNSCGNVGHSETLGRLARISGLLRMST